MSMISLPSQRLTAEEASTLDGLLRARIERSQDEIAYRYFDKTDNQWRTASWRQVGAEVARWQAGLSSLNLGPGDRVALILKNSLEWIIFEQAALGLGLIVIPLYTDDRPDNIAFIIEDAGIKLLLVQDLKRWERLAPALNEHPSLQNVILLENGCDEFIDEDDRLACSDTLLPSGDHPLTGHPTDPHSLATIVYTSGTTGRPKGVMLSHHNILSIADSGISMAAFYAEDEFLSFLPLSHMLERTAGYYLPMMCGATVSFARSITQLPEDLQNIRPTVLISVPRIYERIYTRVATQLEKEPAYKRWLFNMAVAVGWHHFEYRQGRRHWHPKLLLHPTLRTLVGNKISRRLGGRIRLAISGGAALSPDIAHIFLGLGVPILQGYGLTETSPVISVNLPDDNDPASVGVPLKGIEVRLGPDHELQVRSPGTMLGYWNNHKATAEMIDSEGWLGTGDQAQIENNHIYITGRIKDILVLSNGEKVPPADMEMAIALDPLIEQVMVIGEGQAYLSALAVLNAEQWPAFAQSCGVDPLETDSLNDRHVTAAMLKRITEQLHNFPGYAKIRRVHLTLNAWSVDNGLLTPTLKVKRNKVLERMHAEIEALYR